MSSSSRKLRRTSQRSQSLNKGPALAEAIAGINEAAATLGSVGELPEVIDDLRGATKRAQEIAEEAEGNYEGLIQKITRLEDVTSQLRKDYEDLKDRHARLASQVDSEVL